MSFHKEKEEQTKNECLTPNIVPSLASKLREFGLDEHIWENRFNDVGMKNSEQLQHIDTKTLNKLDILTDHDWEKKALSKVWCTYNEREVFAKKSEDFEKMCKTLPDQKTLIKKTLANDRQVINEAFKEKELIQKDPSGYRVVNRKYLKSCDIIKKIAAGQLLRGQFIHENLQTSSTYRQQLIDVDDNIEIMSPGINETMETLEIYDREQSDKFESVLKQYGISFATAIHVGIKNVAYGNVKASGGRHCSKQVNKRNDKQISFVSLNQILVVPTASFTLSNQSVYLSKCALDALRYLHGCFQKNDSSFENQCMLFFSEFGSHFFTGVCHFGGRYKWTVTSETNSEKGCSQNYKAAKHALSGSVGGGYMWFEAEVQGEFQHKTENVTETREFSELCKVGKKLEKFGGPQEVDDIKLWKKGLTEYNNTWVIIDKDVSQKCYEGVWKLVQGKENEFPNAIEFSKRIQTAWGNIYKEAARDEMSWSLPQIFLDWKSEGKRYGYSAQEMLSRPDLVETSKGPMDDEKSGVVKTNTEELQPMRLDRMESKFLTSQPSRRKSQLPSHWQDNPSRTESKK